MNDNVVLSYHDSLLYESDLALLSESTAWLNDRLIAFVYEYLERERYNHESTSHLMAFVNPSTVQYLKLAVGDLNDAIACFIDPLELNNKKYIFLPLNNNSSLESSGGCHWSLLLVDSSSKRLLHFDSIGSNKHIADSFFKRAKIYFNVDRIEHVNFPKQTNSSDCGVYVLAGTELLASYLKDSATLDKLDFSSLTPQYISSLRKTYKKLILDKQNE